MKKEFKALDGALAAVSWEWLEQTHPLIAEALIYEVGRGGQPKDLKLHVLSATGRPELALRVEQAATFLVAQGD